MGKTAVLMGIAFGFLSCGQGSRGDRSPLTSPEAYIVYDSPNPNRPPSDSPPTSPESAPENLGRQPAISSFEDFRMRLESTTSFAAPQSGKTYNYKHLPESIYGSFSRSYNPSQEGQIHMNLRWLAQKAASDPQGYSYRGGIHYISDGEYYYGIRFEVPLFANPISKINLSDGSGYQLTD